MLQLTSQRQALYCYEARETRSVRLCRRACRCSLPTISMFYGIVIRMYCGAAEHHPPHVHAYYQDYRASVDIGTGEIIKGELPRRHARLVAAWVELHRDELAADWELASRGELPFKIEPLR